MKQHELTSNIPAATSVAMRKGSGMVRGRRLTGRLIAVLVMGAGGLSGCISVNAPDKPIVIELNINIRQEVIYRLADDAAGTIQDNPEIF